MKYLETKTPYTVVSKTGETTYRTVVRCYGNATFRVFLNGAPVQKIFGSEGEATEYAKFCADNQAAITFGTVTEYDEYTLADEAAAIDEEIEQCSQKNDCRACGLASCYKNPSYHPEEVWWGRED